MEIIYNDTNDEINNTDGINLASQQAVSTAANVHQKLSLSKNILSVASRLNKVLKASHHTSKSLNHMMQSPGLLAFRLITTLLLSFYGMVKLLSDPEQTDATKVAKLLQAHIVLVLLVTALLSPASSVPIMFVLCSHDFINTSFGLFFNYQTIVNASMATVKNMAYASSEPTLNAKKALRNKLTQHNKLIQKLLLIAFAILGVGLTLCPPAQLAGTTLLLLSTAGGIGTSLIKPVPWQAIGQRLSSAGMFACKQAESLYTQPSTWSTPKHCLVV